MKPLPRDVTGETIDCGRRPGLANFFPRRRSAENSRSLQKAPKGAFAGQTCDPGGDGGSAVGRLAGSDGRLFTVRTLAASGIAEN
jgi:hypothetical protein